LADGITGKEDHGRSPSRREPLVGEPDRRSALL
jgi:hypothetical protein